jgi:leucyl/phenylalanyl-tRNA--protein transferase
MTALPWLDPYDDEQPFPPADCALTEPDGLLAVGGSLAPSRLLRAYRNGIFPWYSEGQPILWWSPDPRTILLPAQVKIARSLRKTLRQQRFDLSMDRAFEAVISSCGEPRKGECGTWLSAPMKAAYRRLHQLGYAHSVETWHAGRLVGGLYGVAIGRVFYGESMFSRMTDASKVALVHLCAQLRRWEFALIDCQMHTTHLASMGAQAIPRQLFIELLEQLCALPGKPRQWRCDDDLLSDILGYGRTTA